MKVSNSPNVEAKRIRDKYNTEIYEKKKVSEKIIENIENTSPASTGFWGFLYIIAGVILCPVVCVCSCNSMGGFDDINIILGVAVAGACLLAYYIHEKVYDKIFYEFYKEKNIRIENERKNIIEVEKELESKCSQEIESYRFAYEELAQKQSLRFVESNVTKEISEWVCKGFYSYIDGASRESHIEKVEMPLEIDVYSSKIRSSFGEYDFEKNRCDNLQNSLEQTALGRAIASLVQLDIMMNYPKNEFDENVEIMIDYTYLDDCTRVTVSYNADNSNYREIRNW